MKVKGSFTLEAALIFPAVLFIIFSIIYLCFYMHDKVTIEGVINDALLRGRNSVKYEIDMDTSTQNTTKYLNANRMIPENDNLSKESKIKIYLQKELQKGLFIANTTGVEAKVNKGEVAIIVNGYMKIPFIEFRKYFEKSGLTFKFDQNVKIHQTMNDIRIFDIGIDLITKYSKETD